VNVIKIKTPIWNGGNRCVGIAEYKLIGAGVYIDILYRNKTGEKTYPNRFRLDRSVAMECPVKTIRISSSRHLRLRIVPIDSMEIII